MILNHCLKIKEDSSNEEENVEELLKDLGKQTATENTGFSLFGFWGGGKREVVRQDVDEMVKQAVFAEI